MQVDLSSVGMEKGKQYETIISTRNEKGISNAAPIGVICAGENIILNRIFKGSTTLNNILEQREFVVNVTHDAELFTLATLGNPDESFFNEDNSLKIADAYFRCEVISFTQAVKQSDPVKKRDEAIVIKSKAVEIKINRPVRALNRSFGYVVESLTDLMRFDMAGEKEKLSYLDRFREANRIVNKVGYKEEKLAMKEIKKELKRKRF